MSPEIKANMEKEEMCIGVDNGAAGAAAAAPIIWLVVVVQK